MVQSLYYIRPPSFLDCAKNKLTRTKDLLIYRTDRRWKGRLTIAFNVTKVSSQGYWGRW
ncbi:hypothetical protein SCLCIDRAFT_1216378 [Scleroderma citrinum Foug A]|uniref:Uncharacterized protein n=1 Tax=Scleroderma citrinum Foug A TaxID=1036808 RepID=A0A0C2ZGS4_9AGAM|nr:hypothetical protein SCLCIDRAFT_1216378 [Scleroderma citrinum Foug A]